jgi:hypothetical protein
MSVCAESCSVGPVRVSCGRPGSCRSALVTSPSWQRRSKRCAAATGPALCLASAAPRELWPSCLVHAPLASRDVLPDPTRPAGRPPEHSPLLLLPPAAGLNDRHPVLGWTPLHEAVVSNSLPMVAALLAAGADPNVPHATRVRRRGSVAAGGVRTRNFSVRRRAPCRLS